MELVVDKGKSVRSLVVKIVCGYFGIEESNSLTYREDEDSREYLCLPQLKFNKGPESAILTEPVTISKKLISELTSFQLDNEIKADEWFSFCAERNYSLEDDHAISLLNSHLKINRFFSSFPDKPCLSDFVVFSSVYNWMKNNSQKEKKSHLWLIVWFDYIQRLQGIYHNPKINLELITYEKSYFFVKCNEETKETAKKLYSEKGSSKNSSFEKALSTKNVQTRPDDDPTRLDIRVGVVIRVWPHPSADKLYCEEIDVGHEKPRTVVSGLRNHISEQDFLNRKVLLLCNLKFKKLRGELSQGMVLCGKGLDERGKEIVELLNPGPNALAGERIKFGSLTGNPDTLIGTPNPNVFQNIQKDLKLRNGKAYWRDHALMTENGEECSCNIIKVGEIS